MAILASAVWRIRLGAGTSNANGGGFDATISGAGTDYSQQNSPQLTISDLQCLVADDASRLKVRSATGGFTAAMVGNAMNIGTGGSFIAGLYFIVGYTSTNLVTLDRTPAAGADLSGGNGRVGGAWADYGGARLSSDNTVNVQAFNRVYIKGSGNPSSTPDWTWTTTDWSQNGCNPSIQWIGEPGFMPHIRASQGCWIYQSRSAVFGNIYGSAGGGGNPYGVLGQGPSVVYDCIINQNGFDVNGINAMYVEGCEVFNSAGGADGTQYGIATSGGNGRIMNCYAHDLRWGGIIAQTGASVIGCVSAKNRGDGLYYNSIDGGYFGSFIGNTLDANLGHGIEINYGYSELPTALFINNLITNHVGSGKYGMYCSGSASGPADRWQQKIFGSAFYGNTTNAGPYLYVADGDVWGNIVLTGDPYIDQANSNYAVNPSLRAMALPRRTWFSSKAGQTAFRSYMDLGAIQRQEPASIASGGGALIL